MYEKVLRNLAGLGKVREDAGHSRRYDVEHRKARVLVVGGGRSGRAAALAAATAGPGSCSSTRTRGSPAPSSRASRSLAPATALGIWEGNLVPVDCGGVLYRYRAERVVVAAGALEQPLVFPGNDLVGVMLPTAFAVWSRDFAIKPGNRAVVLAADERELEIADELREAGVAVPRVVDLRTAPLAHVEAKGVKGGSRCVLLERPPGRCDLLVASAGRQPSYSLARAGGCASRVRGGARDLRPDRAPGRRRGRRLGHRRRAARRSARSARRSGEGRTSASSASART